MAHVCAALGVVIAAALAACGAGQGGGGSPSGSTASATGVLHVVASEAPTCPVETQGEPPCVKPYVGQLDIRSAGGDLVAQPVTSANGTADVTLSPGTYTVTQASGKLPWLKQPVTVTVTAGATATATVDLDTGIR